MYHVLKTLILFSPFTGWMVQGSNPVGGEILCTCPDQPWGPPSLLHNGYQVSFQGGQSSWGAVLTPHAFMACHTENLTFTLPYHTNRSNSLGIRDVDKHTRKKTFANIAVLVQT